MKLEQNHMKEMLPIFFSQSNGLQRKKKGSGFKPKETTKNIKLKN